jgi:hypothetical protein
LRRAAQRALLALFAAVGITVASSTAASAHYVYYGDLVWSNADSSRCLMNRSEVSHGSTGGGYFRGDAMSRSELSAFPTDCTVPWERNTGWLAEGMIAWKWYVDPQGDGSWIVCDRTDIWYYNTEPSSDLMIYADAPAGGGCGAGWYGTGNYAQMLDNGEWHSLAATPAPTKAPPGVNKDGVAPVEALPDSVPVSDASGKPAVDASGDPITTSVLPPEGDATAAQNIAPAAKRTFTTGENGETIEEVHITFDGLLKQ